VHTSSREHVRIASGVSPDQISWPLSTECVSTTTTILAHVYLVINSVTCVAARLVPFLTTVVPLAVAPLPSKETSSLSIYRQGQGSIP
jgi:hypothetical protein